MSKFLIGLLLALGIIAAANAQTPVVHASPAQDQQFYALLARDGLTPNSSTVTLAHEICANIWQGVDPYTEVSLVWKAGPSLTWDDAMHFVADSIIAYCPPSGAGARGGQGTTV